MFLPLLSVYRVDASTLASAEELDPNTVTPGVIGFFAIFFIAAATVLLLLDMTRRVRRTRYRGEIREQLDAEEAEAAETAAIARARATGNPTTDTSAPIGEASAKDSPTL